MQTKQASTIISRNGREIPKDEFYILEPTDMRRPETIGSRLKSAREGLGLSVAQLVEKIRIDHRAEVAESTIRGLEKDKTPNPGIKTLEFCALGVGLDPLEIFGMALDERPENEPGFRESQFAQLWKKYSKIKDRDEREFYDRQIQMLMRNMDSR